MFHIVSHQVDADLHSNVKPTHTLENDPNLKHWREERWREMWGHGHSHVRWREWKTGQPLGKQFAGFL